MSLVSVAVVIAALWQDGFTPAFPGALERMERARTRITHADVAWSRIDYFDQMIGPDPRVYRSLLAHSHSAFINDGTPSGVAAWFDDGTPVPESRVGELIRDNERWEMERDRFNAKVWEATEPEPQTDVRTIGLAPVPLTIATVPAVVRDFPADTLGKRQYREQTVGDLVHVEMRIDDARTLIRWTIDPRRGWNPLHTEYEVEGRVITRCESEYAEFDAVWFPTQVTYYDGAGNVTTSFSVEDAKLNRADLPRRLEPEHIGVCDGTSVLMVRGPRAGASLFYFTGHGLLGDEESNRAVDEGLLAPDPRIIARSERIKAETRARQAAAAATQPSTVGGAATPASGPASRPATLPHETDDAWDRYVREFIARYRLDDAQSQRARAILLECKQERTRFLVARKQRVDHLAEILTAGEKDKKPAAQRELDEIRSRVERIFESELKPRLEKIPTRAQRDAASAAGPGSSASSAPASRRGP